MTYWYKNKDDTFHTASPLVDHITPIDFALSHMTYHKRKMNNPALLLAILLRTYNDTTESKEVGGQMYIITNWKM